MGRAARAGRAPQDAGVAAARWAPLALGALLILLREANFGVGLTSTTVKPGGSEGGRSARIRAVAFVCLRGLVVLQEGGSLNPSLYVLAAACDEPDYP